MKLIIKTDVPLTEEELENLTVIKKYWSYQYKHYEGHYDRTWGYTPRTF